MNNFDQQLEQEINAISIEAKSKGFASSKKVIYKTNFTTIVAYAFHIPNKQTGEIHHFNLKINKYKRKNTKGSWKLEIDKFENHFHGNFQSLEIKQKEAVEELTKFLNAQFSCIGQKLEKDKTIIDKPDEIDLEDFLKKITTNQKEEFSFGIKIQNLKDYRDFLQSNLDKNEAFIQSWLDQEKGKFRKQRCLIFGLEFIDHKREGELCRKRFDILTRTHETGNEYVIFELKSPCDDVFDIKKEAKNKNGGKSPEYSLSSSLSRSIPQILHYKSLVEEKKETDDDLQRIGIEAGKISKCIILIGQRKKDDPIWEKHFRNLKNNFSNVLEIWTYSDLINKLDTTIKNLEENLN